MKRKQAAATRAMPQPAPLQSTRQASATDDNGHELQIREAAYYRYLARGAVVGHEIEDWLQAEAELLRSREADDTCH